MVRLAGISSPPGETDMSEGVVVGAPARGIQIVAGQPVLFPTSEGLSRSWQSGKALLTYDGLAVYG